jgi:putative membrane protein
MFQVSTTIPAGKWKNIKTPGASQVVVGDQIQVAWMVFPFPKEEISLEMQGNNIELNPIEIAALPTVLPLPSLDMDSELNQLIVGLGQLESSLNKMGSAAQEIQRNQEKIADGCSQVAAGLGELEEGVKGAYEGSGQLAGGLEQLRQQLAASNEQLTQQLTELLAQQTQQTQELITQF